MSLIHNAMVPASTATACLLAWNQCLIVWVLALCYFRYQRRISKPIAVFASVHAILLTIANLLSPPIFTGTMLFLHPLVGLWILEREIRRTRKTWLNSYHWCLLSIPIAVLGLFLFLNGVPPDTENSQTLTRLSGNPGNMLFADASPAMMLSIYAFLQMVHYAIWVVAMPIVSQSWKRWRLDFMPALRNRAKLQAMVRIGFAMSGLAVICLWIGFKLDYTATLDFYVLLSTLHVLSEVPFMFWMYES